MRLGRGRAAPSRGARPRVEIEGFVVVCCMFDEFICDAFMFKQCAKLSNRITRGNSYKTN